jgi:hypothetical protein
MEATSSTLVILTGTSSVNRSRSRPALVSDHVGLTDVYPHLGMTEKRMKSYECFLDDSKRRAALGLKYYNFQ